MRIFILIIILATSIHSQILEKQNKLLWDGTDWNNISITVSNNPEMTNKIKSSYYLKAWGEKQSFSDSLYGDRIDYMTRREIIRQLNRFYEDPLMSYVPVVSAMIIVHMQTEQISKKVVNAYIEQTKYWINQITLDMQSRGMHNILKEKQTRPKLKNR